METARKLPVQLNRKQYENLFESFDYTKGTTVERCRQRVRGWSGMTSREGEGRVDEEDADTFRDGGDERDGGSLRGAQKQWAAIRLAKRIAFLLSN